ncbi:site-specific integrase [Curtobacterium sp. 24E2]
MTSPDGGSDPHLTAYFNAAQFRRLAETTRLSYVTACRLFFDFLWLRGKRWNEATVDDLDDWEDWRRRAPANPKPIGGSAWIRERAALKGLYDWGLSVGIIDTHPVRMVTVRARDGAMIEVAEAAAHDVRSTNVKWLTPRASRRWRDIGLAGRGLEGLHDPTFRGRNGDRNVVFADLLFDSGLRRTEGASLLTVELPVMDGGSRYLWGRVASAAAKYNSGRRFPVSVATLRLIRAYLDTTRSEAVSRAQEVDRYGAVPNKWVVFDVTTKARGTTLEWSEEDSGRTRQMPVDRLGVSERMRLFRDGPGGLEPMWLWLSEDGLPFQSHSWERVFAAANDRCARVLGDGAPYCTPTWRGTRSR